jgi:hypothetical protein
MLFVKNLEVSKEKTRLVRHWKYSRQLDFKSNFEKYKARRYKMLKKTNVAIFDSNISEIHNRWYNILSRIKSLYRNNTNKFYPVGKSGNIDGENKLK